MSDKLTVYEAVNEVRQAVGAVAKGQKASGFAGGYAYRGHEGVVNALSKPMNDHGVHVLPEAVADVVTEWQENKKGNLERLVGAVYSFRVVGPAGDSFAVQIYAEGMNQRDKGAGSAFTYAHRRALEAVFNLPTQDADVEEINEPVQARSRARRGAGRGSGGDDRRQPSGASPAASTPVSGDSGESPRDAMLRRFLHLPSKESVAAKRALEVLPRPSNPDEMCWPLQALEHDDDVARAIDELDLLGVPA